MPLSLSLRYAAKREALQKAKEEEDDQECTFKPHVLTKGYHNTRTHSALPTDALQQCHMYTDSCCCCAYCACVLLQACIYITVLTPPPDSVRLVLQVSSGKQHAAPPPPPPPLTFHSCALLCTTEPLRPRSHTYSGKSAATHLPNHPPHHSPLIYLLRTRVPSPTCSL